VALCRQKTRQRAGRRGRAHRSRCSPSGEAWRGSRVRSPSTPSAGRLPRIRLRRPEAESACLQVASSRVRDSSNSRPQVRPGDRSRPGGRIKVGLRSVGKPIPVEEAPIEDSSPETGGYRLLGRSVIWLDWDRLARSSHSGAPVDLGEARS